MPTKKTFWAKVVLKVLKAELAKRGMSYGQLREALVSVGVEETETNIRNKFSRGTFSAIFFVQCLRAIGVKNLVFDETVFKEENLRSKN